MLEIWIFWAHLKSGAAMRFLCQYWIITKKCVVFMSYLFIFHYMIYLKKSNESAQKTIPKRIQKGVDIHEIISPLISSWFGSWAAFHLRLTSTVLTKKEGISELCWNIMERYKKLIILAITLIQNNLWGCNKVNNIQRRNRRA